MSTGQDKWLDTERFNVVLKGRSTFAKPLILSGARITEPRQGTPSTFDFEMIDDGNTPISLGDQVRFQIDGENIWYGFVFKMEHTKNKTFKVTCYDQLRYLKFKDTYVYQDMTYAALLKAIAKDRGLITGTIEETEYKIPGRIEENKEYWEILAEASKLTSAYTGNIFVLYDKAGKICLQSIQNMKADGYIITKRMGEDVEYTESIDDQTYNRIKVDVTDKESNKVTPVVVESQDSMNRWGALQYYATSTEPITQVKDKAQKLLKMFNKSTRTIKFKKLFGDPRIRGGSLIPVILNLRGIEINGYMMAESVEHEFSGGHHYMSFEAYSKDFLPEVEEDGYFINEKEEAKNGSVMQSGVGPYGTSGKRARLLTAARSHIGEKYSQAKRNQPGYKDCSSLVKHSMIEAGLAPKNYELTTRTVKSDPHFIPIAKSQLQPGDVLWHEGHMAFYIGGKNTLESNVSGMRVDEYNWLNYYTRFYRIAGIDS